MLPFRSLLFLPSDNYALIEKSLRKGADARVLDLEDSVSSNAKERARQNIMHYLSQHPEYTSHLYIRLNTPGPEQEKDCQLIRAFPHLAGVVLPKIRKRADVDLIAAALDSPTLPLYIIIESAYGLLQTAHIAQHPQVHAVLFGTEDFSDDLGCYPTRDILSPYFQQLILAAKSVQKAVIGFPDSIAQYQDVSRLQASLQAGFDMGADAAFCIHPTQIPYIHRAYCPRPETITWAQDILAHHEKSGDTLFSWQKNMIEQPSLERARRIMKRYAYTQQKSSTD